MIPSLANTDTGGLWLYRTNQIIGVINQLTDGLLYVNGSIIFTNGLFSLQFTSGNVGNNIVLSAPSGNTLYLTSSNAVVNGTIYITGPGNALVVSNNSILPTINSTSIGVTNLYGTNASLTTINATAATITTINTDSISSNSLYDNGKRVLTEFNIKSANGITSNVANINASSLILNISLSMLNSVTSTSVSQPPTAAAVNTVNNSVITLSNAALIKSAGGNITGPIIANVSTGGGWSSFVVGKQLLLTCATNVNNPSIGFTDAGGANLWALFCTSGTMNMAGMPDRSNTTQPPNIIQTWANTGSSITGQLNVSSDISVSGSIKSVGVITAASGTSANQVVNFSQFDQTQSQLGHVKFPGNTIFQWGKALQNGTGIIPATFEVVFDTVYSITATAISSTSGADPVNIDSITTSGFNIHVAHNNIDVYWQAIGIKT